MSHSKILLNKTLFKIHLSGGLQNGSDYNPVLIGGSEGSRVLPSSGVAVDRYLDGVIQFEPVIFNPSWGIFTLPIYYETGIADLLKSDSESWHGPGFGFRFYVDKVAIPAMGADFTWDLSNNIFKVAVSIGGASR